MYINTSTCSIVFALYYRIHCICILYIYGFDEEKKISGRINESVYEYEQLSRWNPKMVWFMEKEMCDSISDVKALSC